MQQQQGSQSTRLPERIVLLIIDGLGDVTISDLGDRTPLEVAHTPCLDAIAAAGLNGLMDPVEPGLACGSDTAHMSILGYDPRSFYRGRGAFESMGAGIHMAPGDIAFKCNFATINPSTGIVEHRRADRDFEHLGPTLCAALDGLALPSFPQHTVSVKYATEHRCGIAVSGPGLSDSVSGTDPLKDDLPLMVPQPLDGSEEALHTAAVVAELSSEIHRILVGHAINQDRAAAGKNLANIVLLRGCGSRIKVESFLQRHGLKAALVAPTKIIAGLGMSFDIDVIEAPGANGSYTSAFHEKAKAIAEAVTSGGHSFGLLHVKAVDDTGHDRRVAMKVRFLEVVDKMVGQLLQLLWKQEVLQPQQCYSLIVTGDHSTPVQFGDHSHEPVPVAIAHVRHIVQAVMQDARRKACWAGRPWDPQMPAEIFGGYREAWPQAVLGDPVRSFDEVSAARGSLGRFPGSQIMPLVKHFIGQTQGPSNEP
ncbi:MAG: hypothetical protein WDW38_004353 [Sanguina aurantia]